MNVYRRVITVVFLVTSALGALGAPAMAAPMPWETSKIPGASVVPAVPSVSSVPSVADGDDGTFTVQCGNPCYQ